MPIKISVVINTLNEEKNIERAMESVKFADEIIVCDMHSKDDTVKIAKSLGARIIYHQQTGFVEPARNFAISKSSGEWVLVIDADEEVPDSLRKALQGVISEDKADYVRLPRKNIIFGKWMRASGWWPDYNVRFFKSGKVIWSDEIHRPPKTTGSGIDLPQEEKLAIIHYNYSSISQFIERMNRYTSIEASQLTKSGYKFSWLDLISKPVNEFLSRFFAHHGFEDGLHGLALSLLQALSFAVVYLKVWEKEGFKSQQVSLPELQQVGQKSGQDIHYWFDRSSRSVKPFKSFLQKFKNKFV